MKNVLILVFSNLKHDARVMRQIQWLKKDYHLTVVCFDADEAEGITFIKIQQTKLTLLRKAFMSICLLLRQFNWAYKLFHDYSFLIHELGSTSYDLIISNDIDTLPLAFQLKANSKIIFDAHEYAPRHFENNRIWKIFFQPFYINFCRKYIPQVDAMLTVGKGLANEYEKNFGRKPVIITNATRYFEIEPSVVHYNKIRLIHHGIANTSRRLELMIDMMDHLDERFTLDMILMTSDYASPQTKTYIEAIKNRIGKNPRINILPPVKSSEVVPTINAYDIGVFLLPPVNFNYANTLPNKLFDFIQARLAVAIGPTPEMADIVNRFDLGVVSEDFTPKSLAEKLSTLDPDRLGYFKSKSKQAALELNAEKNEKIFRALLKQLNL
ncbi:MAG: hypothetical protein JNM57_00785 [Cyclobacteriaceae bacterium]|nr:hypothetical protein [Cyclobacteriaceae bacterium]